MPADDQPARVRHARQRLEQDVDALPRIEMSGVRHDAAPTSGGVELRVGRTASDPRRRQARPPDDRARRRTVRVELAAERRRDRDIAVRAAATRALRAARAAAASRATAAARRRDEVRAAPPRRPARTRATRRRPAHAARRGTRSSSDASAEVAREDDVGAAARRARGRARTPGSRAAARPPVRATGARSIRRRGDRRQPVERERIPRRRVRVGPHDQRHVVPARRQRMARLHRLDAVGALQREADVGEVQDAHGDVTVIRAVRAVAACRTTSRSTR